MQPIIVGTAFIVLSVAVVLAAWRRPGLGRALLGTLFVLMGGVNVYFAISDPSSYQDLYGERAWIPAYRDVINGPFADNATAFVLTVGLTQLAMGAAVLANRWAVRPALAGMIVFLIAVTPAGPENVINLVLAAGASILLLTPRPSTELKAAANPGTAGAPAAP